MKHMSVVKNLAHRIRLSAEHVMYKRYQPDINILKRKRNRYDLEGWCAITSQVLFVALRARGIPCKFCWSNEHAFVIYNNHIIDITATQFGKKDKVFITSYNSRPEEWWDISGSISEINGLVNNRTSWATSLPFHNGYISSWQTYILNHLNKV